MTLLLPEKARPGAPREQSKPPAHQHPEAATIGIATHLATECLDGLHCTLTRGERDVSVLLVVERNESLPVKPLHSGRAPTHLRHPDTSNPPLNDNSLERAIQARCGPSYGRSRARAGLSLDPGAGGPKNAETKLAWQLWGSSRPTCLFCAWIATLPGSRSSFPALEACPLRAVPHHIS